MSDAMTPLATALHTALQAVPDAWANEIYAEGDALPTPGLLRFDGIVDTGIVAEAIEATVRESRTVRTISELEALPVSTVVRSYADTIAARFDSSRGVIFGDDRPIRWSSLQLPATILWHPRGSAHV